MAATSGIPGLNGEGVVATSRRFHYTFNTATRASGTVEQPSFNFRDVERLNYVKMSVRKIIVPMTFHNVIEGTNDKIVPCWNTGSGVAYWTYTIPPGLYTSWLDALKAGFRGTAYQATPRLTTADDYDSKGASTKLVYVDLVSGGKGLNHVTVDFAWAHPFLSVSEFGFQGTSALWEQPSTQTTAWRLLGIPETGVRRPADLSAPPGHIYALTPYPPDVWQGMRTLNFECSIVGGHMYSTTRERMVSVVERVPLQIGDTPPIIGNVLEYEPPHLSSWYVESFSTVSQLKFEVRDNLNRVVDFHGADWSIEFLVEEL